MDILEKYKENKRDEETYKIIGAAMDVHKVLGPGLLESAYGDALEIEFKLRGIPAVREKELPVLYKGQVLKTRYFADFLCYNDVIIELKAVDRLLNIHVAQLLHYLNITGIKKGLLLNFRPERLEYKRYIL